MIDNITPKEIVEHLFHLLDEWNESRGKYTHEQIKQEFEKAIAVERYRRNLVEAPRNFSMKKVEELELENNKFRETLTLIANPKRTDGTYNRSREACELLAKEALTPVIKKDF